MARTSPITLTLTPAQAFVLRDALTRTRDALPATPTSNPHVVEYGYYLDAILGLLDNAAIRSGFDRYAYSTEEFDALLDQQDQQDRDES